jgi:GcrA cell cycle regulator
MTRIYTGDSFDWTDERVAELKRLWADGCSQAQISARFGISSSAVAGKIKRLHLVRGKIVQLKTTERPALPTAKPKSPNRNDGIFPRSQQTAPQPAPPPERLPASIPPSPDREPITFDALSRDVCRWPLNDGGAEGWLFCGEPRDPHSHVYCRHHHARAIDPIARQRFLRRA